jgi:predicted nucleotidyltransferase
MVTNLLAQLARGLDRLGLPYAVMGGQAVLLYGEPRLTRDIDLTLGVSTDRLPELLTFVADAGWRVLPPHAREFVARHLVLPCEDEASGVRFDFIFGLTPFERQTIERSKVVSMAGAGVRFVTVEDLLIHKLVAGRDRDLQDARGLLGKHPEMDYAYLRHWLTQFDESLGMNTLERLAQVSAGV